MKQMIFLTILLFCVSVFASAQAHSNSSKKTSTTVNSKKTNKKNNYKTVETDSLDNRKEYMFKNGQKATPTGHEAASVNDQSYIALKKDSTASVIIKKDTAKKKKKQ